MRTCIKNIFLLPALMAGLGLMPTGRVVAQTFTVLHSFTGNDGVSPQAGLILSGNTLYGTASGGGSSGKGTVFAVNTDGSGFTNLYNFTATTGSRSTNSDGANPQAGLILSGNTLYGTATSGDSSGYGTVFAINTDGSGFTNLHSFTGSDGARPLAGLILSGNTLYGTTFAGGTIFAVNTDGIDFTNLHIFAQNGEDHPLAGLVLSGNTLYGTTVPYLGSSGNDGTVFKVNTDGTSFTNLYSFTGESDGSDPFAGLILSGNTLYGTTRHGGSSDNGIVFAINTDGTRFTNLYNFTGGINGANPVAGLILSGSTLYGTTSSSDSTVFAVNTNGAGFTNLFTFIGSIYGSYPQAGLILSGNTLYGTTSSGGSSDNGTVFSLSFPSPQLTIISSGTNVNLTWPNGVAGFSYSGYTLQSSTNLVSPAVWNAAFPAPVIVNGQNTVTNAIFGTQQFFRLSHS